MDTLYWFVLLYIVFGSNYGRARVRDKKILVHFSTKWSAKCRHACVCHFLVVSLQRENNSVFFIIGDFYGETLRTACVVITRAFFL